MSEIEFRFDFTDPFDSQGRSETFEFLGVSMRAADGYLFFALPTDGRGENEVLEEARTLAHRLEAFVTLFIGAPLACVAPGTGCYRVDPAQRGWIKVGSATAALKASFSVSAGGGTPPTLRTTLPPGLHGIPSLNSRAFDKAVRAACDINAAIREENTRIKACHLRNALDDAKGAAISAGLVASHDEPLCAVCDALDLGTDFLRDYDVIKRIEDVRHYRVSDDGMDTEPEAENLPEAERMITVLVRRLLEKLCESPA